jgi:hypothetical protein
MVRRFIANKSAIFSRQPQILARTSTQYSRTGSHVFTRNCRIPASAGMADSQLPTDAEPGSDRAAGAQIAAMRSQRPGSEHDRAWRPA